MTEETVNKLLKEIGLTDKETEVYVFLSRRGTLKGLEVTKQMKKGKAQIYSILRNLQNKGLVEQTLEFPARFTAVPLEIAIDLNIKAKREAAALIESTKKDILNYWRTISQPEKSISPEKFNVVEGSRKIYPKIAQMIKETKKQLSVISSLQDLLRINQHGVFETVLENTMNSSIECRVITEFSAKNVKILEELLETLPLGLNFQGKTPDLGLRLSPRMVIRDNEEILFFMSSEEKPSISAENDACLWTNCKALVQSFSSVFEDLWSKSRDLKQKIAEIETGKLKTQRRFMFNQKSVEKMYNETIETAKKEIVMLTSSEGLELWKHEPLKKVAEKTEISIKVMTPASSEKLYFVQAMLRNGEIRRVTEADLTSVLVDRCHIFQLGNPRHARKLVSLSSFENFLYTDDLEYVQKTSLLLDAIWKGAPSTSSVMLNSTKSVLPLKIRMCHGKVDGFEEYEEGMISEKEIINEMINAKKIPAKDPYKDMNVQYSSFAGAYIHPPSYFNIPDMLIDIWHCNKQSSFGAEDCINIYLLLETSEGRTYIPVAHVTDNAEATEFRKGVWAKTPAEKNIILMRRDQLQIQVHGNTLFAGWIVPIPLYPPQYTLPPCCILFEGFGELKSGTVKTKLPSGKTQLHKFNAFEASVTFFHPSSKYSASGIDGIFYREHIMIAYPPPDK